MKDYTYFQLVAFFYDDILRLISQKQSYIESINIAYYNSVFYPEEEEDNFVGNFIILTLTLEMDSRFKIPLSEITREIFLKKLEQFNILSIEDYLNETEAEHFLEVIFDVKHYIKQFTR